MMGTVEIDAYPTCGPESLYNKAKKAGLTDQAADYFRHFEEIWVVFTVDVETGQALELRLGGPTTWAKEKAPWA